MASVYITLSNAKNIVMGKTKLKDLNLTGAVYKKPIYFFSKFEKIELLAFQELLKDPEKYFNTIYSALKREDTYTMVKEGIYPAYHCDYDCSKLRGDYENLKIPEIIKKELGLDGVKEVRKLYQENPEFFMKNPDQFFVRLYNKLKHNKKVEEELVKIIQSNSSRSYLVELPNGGVVTTQNLTADEAEKQVEKLLFEYQKFFRASEKNKDILSAYGQWSYQANKREGIQNNSTKYSDEEVTGVLREFDSMFKKPLIVLLCQYYQLTMNSKLAFDSKYLDAIGFKPCRACHGDENLEFTDNESPFGPLPSPINSKPDSNNM